MKGLKMFCLLVVCVSQVILCSGGRTAEPGTHGFRQPPYGPDSPWNLKIGPAPVYDPNSTVVVRALHGVFGSDPTRYTMPVYAVDLETPMVTVRFSGLFSNVTENGEALAVLKRPDLQVPVPSHAHQARGRDGQMILWNPETGDELGFWRMKKAGDIWMAVNGYHYNTRWSGVPPVGFISRGAGVPYLAGLIRPWEIAQGRIDHAIAFGVDYPNRLFVYPATKSDGKGLDHFLPAGARLQLDPFLTADDFTGWGLDRAGKIIARALQSYGMILIDGSGHPKIYAEYEGTANWNGEIHKNTVRQIPYTAFRVLSLTTPRQPVAPASVGAEPLEKGIQITWEPSPTATRYRIKKRTGGQGEFILLDPWVKKTGYLDVTVVKGETYTYWVSGVSHNGVSPGAISATVTY
ncbi:MAG: fibronectin type III domain-containing protein [Desulfobacterium sp.]|nr:fibronectin type III domain-containing protein [Desulfobacterium sp.]